MDWVHFYSVNLDIYSGTKIAMDIKSGKFPQVYGNIATTKLIQWKTAEMRGNKAFRGFGGFIFGLFSVAGVTLPSKFAPPFNDSR